MINRSNYLSYAALAAVCLIWGTTYLAMRIAVTTFPPFLFIVIRQLIAGSIMIGFMLTVGKAKWPSKQEIFMQSIGGFLLLSMGNGLVAWSEVHVPSGIAAIICSVMPIWVIIINLTINKDEKPTVPIMLGAAMGLAGIIMIFGENLSDFSNTAYMLGIIMTIVATLSWAGGSIWLKKRQSTGNPFLNAGIQMFSAGVWLIPFSLVFDDLNAVQWTADSIYPLIYLIIFGSLIAYTCYMYALRKLPMTIVSMYAYINPLVAVLLGWIILDEPLNARIGIAFLLTVGGIYIVNRGYQLRDLWRAQFSER